MPRNKAKSVPQPPRENLKRKAQEPEDTEEENIIDAEVQALEPEQGCIVPRFNTKVHFYHRTFVVKVVLHKIPEKCLNLEPTDEEFYLDTKKFSKKFYLKFAYPQRIKVNAEGCTAVFDGGCLTCTFPITQIYDKETGKTMRKKQKTDAAQTPSSAPAPAHVQKKKAPAKKVKKVEEAASATGDVEQEALAVIDEVASKIDEKQKQKVEKEQAKVKFFEEKEQQKLQKRKQRAQQRQDAVAKVRETVDQLKTEQKTAKELQEKPFKASKVKFSDQDEVLEEPAKKTVHKAPVKKNGGPSPAKPTAQKGKKPQKK